MPHPVAETRDMSAPPDLVWSMVSDLCRMGEWSPENTGGRWVAGDGPAVGAVFRGRNRRGLLRWSTTVRVTEAEPGRAFEMGVTFAGVGVATWRYDIEATPAGCRVTESWRDDRAAWTRVVFSVVGDHSAAHAHREMAATLARLAAAAEAAAPAGPAAG